MIKTEAIIKLKNYQLVHSTEGLTQSSTFISFSLSNAHDHLRCNLHLMYCVTGKQVSSHLSAGVSQSQFAADQGLYFFWSEKEELEKNEQSYTLIL